MLEIQERERGGGHHTLEKFNVCWIYNPHRVVWVSIIISVLASLINHLIQQTTARVYVYVGCMYADVFVYADNKQRAMVTRLSIKCHFSIRAFFFRPPEAKHARRFNKVLALTTVASILMLILFLQKIHQTSSVEKQLKWTAVQWCLIGYLKMYTLYTCVCVYAGK